MIGQLLATETGEKVLLHTNFSTYPRGPIFAFAISDRAIYLQSRKRFAAPQDWRYRRVPLAKVREVRIRRVPAIGVWLISLIIGVGGALTLLPLIRNGGPFPDHFLLLVVATAGALLLPLTTLGRRGLVVILNEGRYTWNPPFLQLLFHIPVPLGRRDRAQIKQVLHQIVTACYSAGVPVTGTERPPTWPEG